MKKPILLPAVAAVLFAHSGCESMDWDKGTARRSSSIVKAVCVVQPTTGNDCSGVVSFTQSGQWVKVVANVTGLSPNAQHAIHIHTHGDCTAGDGTSAGGHYNPEGHDHGLPVTERRHAGDLGNLTTDHSGNAQYEIVVDNVTINGTKNPILGRAVIIHAKRDTGGQPTGEAGPRIGCGVIGIANGR